MLLATSLARLKLRVYQYDLLSRLSVSITTEFLFFDVTQLLNLGDVFADLLKIVRIFALQVIHDDLNKLLILNLLQHGFDVISTARTGTVLVAHGNDRVEVIPSILKWNQFDLVLDQNFGSKIVRCIPIFINSNAL